MSRNALKARGRNRCVGDRVEPRNGEVIGFGLGCGNRGTRATIVPIGQVLELVGRSNVQRTSLSGTCIFTTGGGQLRVGRRRESYGSLYTHEGGSWQDTPIALIRTTPERSADHGLSVASGTENLFVRQMNWRKMPRVRSTVCFVASRTVTLADALSSFTQWTRSTITAL